MKRSLFAAAILGLAAIPATAGDVYAPYPGCGNGGVAVGSGPTYAPLNCTYAGREGRTRGGCNSCGKDHCDRRDRWQRFLDFLCYKPTIPCETWPHPTHYTPPLRSWFPSHGSGPCDTGCATTG